ncbi:sulfotransferase domain-containing protein [Cytophaga aurantiaca]|uniref:sulfotransferase domain-containing protein n=1 Tax=Cytophaga aurantiaca TaxID=29530 RepID=UPI0003601876|nr:sulfotransferase domain-containing protein [Cytophaga aurantiaca]
MKKIWIASFPRSGNTFFRNVLFHVYGLDSLEDESLLNENYKKESLVFIKAHLLPYQLKTYNPKKDTVIYLVRDGRDSICSLAFKRKNLIAPDSDMRQNFIEATNAHRGSFFGGWANNCRLWLAEDCILVRFEDLVKNPQATFAELEKKISFPKANWDELPTFEKQKQGIAKHGIEPDYNYAGGDFSQKFFRKGEIGNWKVEMPVECQNSFLEKSADIMALLGYTEDGSINEIDFPRVNEIKSQKAENFKLKLLLKYGALQIKCIEFRDYMIRKLSRANK